MQREIEALLAASLADRNKEAQVVQQLLTALAVGTAGRHQMMQDLAAAVRSIPTVAASTAAPPVDGNLSSPDFSADVSAAIAQLRAARAPITH
jgi:hypothetical protein